MPELEFDLPNEIDGDPEDVAIRVREQLHDLAPEIERLLHQSATQLRSAWLTAALNLEPSMEAEELGRRWAESEFSRRVGRLTAAGNMVGTAVEGLETEGQ